METFFWATIIKGLKILKVVLTPTGPLVFGGVTNRIELLIPTNDLAGRLISKPITFKAGYTMMPEAY